MTIKKTTAGRPEGARKAAPGPGGERRVWSFGGGRAEGDRSLKELLGGKGANLAEMANLGLPVPAGFTITTRVCGEVRERRGRWPEGLEGEVRAALRAVEELHGRRFGEPRDPLLLSVRSGARVSMPGMMDTVLNLGLNDETVGGLAGRSGSPRFAWDAYRRFVQMYGDVVLGVRAREDEHASPMHEPLRRMKAQRGVEDDTALAPDDLRALVRELKAVVRERAGRDFPTDPWEQLVGAIDAVFRSWDNERAIAYRRIHSISDGWGTAVNVMAMVFGNLGPTSGTGVAFTRDPATGERRFYGEYLANAQGEDVVAGLRTPQTLESLERTQPEAWKELLRIQETLEQHYREMQDVEFTIEERRLWMLQCRSGKRTGFAAVRIAVEMAEEGLITPDEALRRVEPQALDQLLQPVFDAGELRAARRAGRLVAKGLPAGPGAATGRIVLRAPEAEAWAARGEPVILVRHETSPEDIKGMQAALGILTAQGGMTSHAALVARQMGKVCVVGAGALQIDYAGRHVRAGERTFEHGDWLSLDGTTGEVFDGRIETRPSEVARRLIGRGRRAKPSPIVAAYETLMGWADAKRRLRVRANADQPDQCKTAVALGAEGIGLCRTEHMFFGEGKIERVQRMILAETLEERRAALSELLPLQRDDFKGILRAMAGFPVVIRTLDPPLHEFLPHDAPSIEALAHRLDLAPDTVARKVASLREQNPMLGHRGCRLGIVHPEITRMQARAIFEAACDVAKEGTPPPLVEVMIPLVGTLRELELQAGEVRAVAEEVLARRKKRVRYLVGTMIELPRAALTAGAIAGEAEFFSFGTNDLTQTTLGISRDDGGKFLPRYLELGIWEQDPFASVDREGVGRLMRIAVEEGRAARPDLEFGICGEHGGDPRTIELCEELGLHYVSCSPWRVPIARLAAARAALARGSGA
jgi:pyruvate,orthophosphate dikinase